MARDDRHAEQRAVWELGSALESALPEVLQDDYPDLLALVRDRARDTKS